MDQLTDEPSALEHALHVANLVLGVGLAAYMLWVLARNDVKTNPWLLSGARQWARLRAERQLQADLARVYFEAGWIVEHARGSA